MQHVVSLSTAAPTRLVLLATMRTIVGGKGGGDNDVVMAPAKAALSTASRTATATTIPTTATATANPVQATSSTSRAHCEKRSRRSRLMMAHKPTRRHHFPPMQQQQQPQSSRNSCYHDHRSYWIARVHIRHRSCSNMVVRRLPPPSQASAPEVPPFPLLVQWLVRMLLLLVVKQRAQQ
jgi:hypothetical protein